MQDWAQPELRYCLETKLTDFGRQEPSVVTTLVDLLAENLVLMPVEEFVMKEPDEKIKIFEDIQRNLYEG